MNVAALGTTDITGRSSLVQAIPTQNFSITTKFSNTRFGNYENAGLILLEVGTNKSILFVSGYHSSYSANALTIHIWNGSTWADLYNYSTYTQTVALLKVEYDITTKISKLYTTFDGFTWRLMHTPSALAFTPDRIGLIFTHNISSGIMNSYVDWFRVQLMA